MGVFVDLVGRSFGYLTVVERAPFRCGGRSRWRCVCNCGAFSEVDATKLKSGHTKSCGCLRRRAGTEAPRFRHGHNSKIGEDTREYRAWSSMIQRCTNPKGKKFSRYGKRGITVCRQWQKDFVVFFQDVGACPGPGYSLDRINNDQGYKPGNVRWATAVTQQRNRSSNRCITALGKTATLAEWSERTGIQRSTIAKRIDIHGWQLDRAVSQPVRRKCVS